MSESLVRLRHSLHRHPELSGHESETAERIADFFQPLGPTIHRDLGGHGVAVEFRGDQPGPTVLLRCELDALPIDETHTADYRSANPGVGHQCGHDGHMAILAAVGQSLAESPIPCGRVVLLYQPAEETGQGAEKVLNDPAFAALQPEFAFALHNLPGVPLGQIVIREGVFTCASRGLSMQLTGATAHAAQPDTGRSPARALCRLTEDLQTLSGPEGEIAFATVVGSRLGEKAFGTAPGDARLWVTLRSETDATMAGLVREAESLLAEVAGEDHLDWSVDHEDIFHATVNAPEAVSIIRRSAGQQPVVEASEPFRWSEDFGRFTRDRVGSLFGIGAGLDVADLHDQNYDFPDPLIPIAAGVFRNIIDNCLEATTW